MAGTLKTYQDTRIFLSKIIDYDASTIYTAKPDRVFQNASELIDFLIINTRKTYKHEYECIYASEQNMTTKDTIVMHENRMSYGKLYTESHTFLRRYWFHDVNDKTIDIRILMPVVIKKIESGYYPVYKFKKSSSKRKYHTHLRHKKLTNKSVIMHNDPVEYEYQDISCTFQPRKRYDLHSYISTRSSGWKNNKQKYQWMHNQIQKDTHAANKQKKHATKGCESSQP